MKKLLKYFKNYKIQSILAPLFKLLEACFELIVPLVVASIIDVGIKDGGGTNYVLKMCLILVGLGVVGLISAISAQFFAAKAAVGFSKELRSDLFKKLQSFSYYEIDKIGTSKMVTRLTSDVNQIQSGVNLFLRLFMRSPFIVFGAMIMAFTIDVEAGWILAATIGVLSIVVYGIMLVSIPLYKKSQSHLDKVTAATRETLVGSRVIRAFCKEDDEISKFSIHNNNLMVSQKFVGKISALMNPLTYALINAGLIWLIYVGALKVDSGVLSQGQVVALYNYMSQILVELIKLANLIITLTKSFASAGRVNEIFETSSKLYHGTDNNVHSNAFIEYRNVSLKYFENGANALNNISFTVNKGETVGIIGGTGSGKTTLINLLPHFYDATEGEVYLNGVNVNAIGDENLRNMCGIVPQNAVLFKGTIKENLLWGNENASSKEIDKAIELACAKDVVHSKENGIEEVIEQNGKNLSGGQRQRLTIARALVKSPEILILDDCASALDYATDAKLRNNLKKLDKDTTVFIISQRTSSIKHADKIIVLDNGEMVGIGTHDELLNSCEVYREIYNTQYEAKEASNG